MNSSWSVSYAIFWKWLIAACYQQQDPRLCEGLQRSLLSDWLILGWKEYLTSLPSPLGNQSDKNPALLSHWIRYGKGEVSKMVRYPHPTPTPRQMFRRAGEGEDKFPKFSLCRWTSSLCRWTSKIYHVWPLTSSTHRQLGTKFLIISLSQALSSLACSKWLRLRLSPSFSSLMKRYYHPHGNTSKPKFLAKPT